METRDVLEEIMEEMAGFAKGKGRWLR